MTTKTSIICFTAFLFLTAGLISCGGNKEEDTTKETTPAAKQDAPAEGNDPYKIGTHVAAKWSDGNYWGATIIGNANGKYQMKFDDGTSNEVSASEIKMITPKGDIKTGDKVLAVWVTNGRMYNGVVQEVQADGAIVKWDDGSTPSFVSFDNITK